MVVRRWRAAVALVATVAVLTGCASAVDGTGSVGPIEVQVQGDSGDYFDQQAKNALADVIGFWTATYPKIDHGAALPLLKGKLYSVDGDEVLSTHRAPSSAQDNQCLQQRLTFIVDNAAYCQLDDSIIWDRATDHLLPVLASAYGPTLTALVFAHEFGHAVQQRLGVDKKHLPTIDIESQADCAAGAFAAAALDGEVANLHITAADLDQALEGFLQIRDSTPDSPQDISHGDGFDRLNALQQGIHSGAAYCFGPGYFTNRTYTERGYVSDDDYTLGGNQPLPDVLAPDGLAQDLNRFWSAAGKTVSKPLTPVKLAEAAHPACGAVSPRSEFGYCASDNTVYYSSAFARQAYYSITVPDVSRTDAAVTLQKNQPGDFALGMLISIGWGLAARHQFFHGSTTDRTGLIAAICYAGAYAEDINRADHDASHPFILSPPDMDEATSAVLGLVELDQAFSARGTTGLERVQAFVKGYNGGLPGC